MAVLNRKILAIIIVSFAFSWQLLPQDMGLGTISSKNFRLPKYNEKTNKAEAIIYGKEGDYLGIMVNIRGVLVDVLKSDITDIRVVKNLENLTVYDINIGSAKVKAFWLAIPHSNALIQTPSAELDRSTNIIRGKDWLKGRSPFADIDGEGFQIDLTKRTLHLEKNVTVIYRKDLYEEAEKEKAEKEKAQKEAEKKDGTTEKEDKTQKKQQ